MFRARMCRSLIFDRVEDWDQRTVHSCAKHKLITQETSSALLGISSGHLRIRKQGWISPAGPWGGGGAYTAEGVLD